jgi:hypothetical protein
MVLDAGNLFAPKDEIDERSLRQVEAKAELVARAYAFAGLDAMTLGSKDLALGLDMVLALQREHDLPIVAANLRDEGGKLLFSPYRLIQLAERTIGVVGAGAAGREERLRDPDTTADVQTAVRKARDQGAEVVLLLSARGTAETQALALALEGVDLIIESGGGRSLRNGEMKGRVPIIAAGSKNKMLGRASLGFVEGANGFDDALGRKQSELLRGSLERRRPVLQQQLAAATNDVERGRLERALKMTDEELERLSESAAQVVVDPGPKHQLFHSLVPLDRKLVDEAKTAAMVQEVKDELGDLLDAPVSRQMKGPRRDMPHPDGPFAGETACRGCHQEQYQQWITTTHARAYYSLTRDRRHMDLECYGCHVTGYQQKGGPTAPNAVGHLANVQCEACHGPGQAHVQKPSKDNIVLRPDEKEVCRVCHSEDQTMGRFEPTTYWAKVDH